MNINELAKEAGFSITTDWMGRPSLVSIGTNGDIGLQGVQELERFAALVRDIQYSQGYLDGASAGKLEGRAKREWVDLTDDEIYPLYNEPISDREAIDFARAVIAAFKEKNK